MSENETDLTRKVIETLANCNKTDSCEICDARTYCTRGASSVKSALATALLAEMDKPGDVWKDAPEKAIRAFTYFYDDKRSFINAKEYTRGLPKSRARVIAEEARTRYERGAVGAGSLDDVIESAILKALAEQESGKC